jgi:hypothetical protein
MVPAHEQENWNIPRTCHVPPNPLLEALTFAEKLPVDVDVVAPFGSISWDVVT